MIIFFGLYGIYAIPDEAFGPPPLFLCFILPLKRSWGGSGEFPFIISYFATFCRQSVGISFSIFGIRIRRACRSLALAIQFLHDKPLFLRRDRKLSSIVRLTMAWMHIVPSLPP
mmetsp:Transcript_3634/g.5538  ORF Transcript_3634/g.5538 Transcript_3634/m.5538 type:complete len:114 (-) Transcript_3634:401-742(-)